MAQLAVLTGDGALLESMRRGMRGRHLLVGARSWERLERLILERPLTGVLLDHHDMGAGNGSAASLRYIRTSFPSVAVVAVARAWSDPLALFRMGRAGLGDLLLLPIDDLVRDANRTVGRALRHGTGALVTRAVSPYLPAAETCAVRYALEAVERGWTTEKVAARVGLSRPYLSERLKSFGLPPLGHLLLWGRLLHAGAWLPDPGRSAESVSRQLGYSSGAAFRRLLRNHVGVTPTELIRRGGRKWVLDRFLDVCGLRPADRTAA